LTFFSHLMVNPPTTHRVCYIHMQSFEFPARSNGSCALTEKKTRRTRPGRLYAANSSRLDSFLFLFFLFFFCFFCLIVFFFTQYGTDRYRDTSVVLTYTIGNPANMY
jgi:hypothetical protein